MQADFAWGDARADGHAVHCDSFPLSDTSSELNAHSCANLSAHTGDYATIADAIEVSIERAALLVAFSCTYSSQPYATSIAGTDNSRRADCSSTLSPYATTKLGTICASDAPSELCSLWDPIGHSFEIAYVGGECLADLRTVAGAFARAECNADKVGSVAGAIIAAVIRANTARYRTARAHECAFDCISDPAAHTHAGRRCREVACSGNGRHHGTARAGQTVLIGR